MPLDSAEPWGVDGVIVVNLDRRPDRWDAFQEAWRDILPWDRVVRLSASDGQQLSGYGERPWFRGRKRDRTWAGRAGCTLSHARALREARRLGWSRVLVMEDDAIPAGPVEAMSAVLSSTEWDLLYLGCREPIGAGDTVGGLMAIHGGHDTHAYAVNEPLRDWLIGQLPDESCVWGWIARERAVDRCGRLLAVLTDEHAAGVLVDGLLPGHGQPDSAECDHRQGDAADELAGCVRKALVKSEDCAADPGNTLRSDPHVYWKISAHNRCVRLAAFCLGACRHPASRGLVHPLGIPAGTTWGRAQAFGNIAPVAGKYHAAQPFLCYPSGLYADLGA